MTYLVLRQQVDPMCCSVLWESTGQGGSRFSDAMTAARYIQQVEPCSPLAIVRINDDGNWQRMDELNSHNRRAARLLSLILDGWCMCCEGLDDRPDYDTLGITYLLSCMCDDLETDDVERALEQARQHASDHPRYQFGAFLWDIVDTMRRPDPFWHIVETSETGA